MILLGFQHFPHGFPQVFNAFRGENVENHRQHNGIFVEEQMENEGFGINGAKLQRLKQHGNLGGLHMIKGVNRQVVEVQETDCDYFEKIMFFVKPE